MKLEVAKTLSEIADILDCEFVGDPNHSITGINEIHKVENGDLVFVDHPKYYDKALESNASIPGVKVKNGSALKESGIITRIGRIRKASTR